MVIRIVLLFQLVFFISCTKNDDQIPIISNAFSSLNMNSDAVVNKRYCDTIHLNSLGTPYFLALCDTSKQWILLDSIFVWTPTTNDTGIHIIKVRVSSNDLIDTISWIINVTGFWPAGCPNYTHKDDVNIGLQQSLPNGFFVYSRFNQPGLYISPIDNFTPVLISNTQEDRIGNISISADGNWICYIDISRSRICLITKYGCNKTVLPLTDVDLGYPMIAGFHRLTPPQNAIFYISNTHTLRSVFVQLNNSTPIFSNDRIIAQLGPTYAFNPNGNVQISVSNNQIFGGIIRKVNGIINYSSGYLTIPQNGNGIASDTTVYKWKDDSTFQAYGCGHTESNDGLFCIANAGLVGSYQCTPQYHNGFYITKFHQYTDSAISFQNEQIDKNAESINWCPTEYQTVGEQKADFWGWYFSNKNEYVIGRQMGSLNEDGIWLIYWPSNTWYRLSPKALNIKTPQPAVHFYSSDSSIELPKFCIDDTNQNALPYDPTTDFFNPHYKILFPNGGEYLTIGSKATIKIHADAPANAVLNFSLDNGKSWNLLPGIANIVNATIDSAITFTVPDSIYNGYEIVPMFSNKCLINLRDYSNQDYYDNSDSCFSIGP